jgi:hypothetical protein
MDEVEAIEKILLTTAGADPLRSCTEDGDVALKGPERGAEMNFRVAVPQTPARASARLACAPRTGALSR